VAFNDKAAVGALRAAYERGLRVSEDLSTTGFDDIDLSRSTVPRLTMSVSHWRRRAGWRCPC
jgi:LacI family transcriptional regulator